MEKEVLEKMYERIKKPINEFIIPNSVPVVYFGDYEKAKACTIALHPSHNETLFYRPRLGISHEDELTDKDAEYVLEKCNHYFENETYIYHSFFDPNEYMINKFAYSYYKDKNKNLCVQLNLVQWLANGWRTILEPTKEKDFEFLEVLLNNGNFERIFLNGIVVKEYMQRIHTFELTGFANEKQFFNKIPIIAYTGIYKNTVSNKNISIMGWSQLIPPFKNHSDIDNLYQLVLKAQKSEDKG